MYLFKLIAKKTGLTFPLVQGRYLKTIQATNQRPYNRRCCWSSNGNQYETPLQTARRMEFRDKQIIKGRKFSDLAYLQVTIPNCFIGQLKFKEV
jgi:hypothetical protein